MPCTAMFILPAVMLSTGMAMLMSMMVALHIGVKGQIACQIGFHGIICCSAYSAEKLNSGFRQGSLCSPSDSAADKCIHALGCKEA